jgi:hypothetical protein
MPQNQLPICIPALVQAHQSIIHILCCLLLRNMRNQVILHRIQQHSLGLHFLLMDCQFPCIIWIWNHHLNIIFKIISSKRKSILAFQARKLVAPSNLSFTLRVLTIVSKQEHKSSATQICSNKSTATCVSRDHSLSL